MDQLERECNSYTQYLTGRAPTEYVLRKYEDFHQKVSVPENAGSPFDQFLVGVSAHGPFRARLADTYASLFRKQCPLRAKLVLTLAILECSPPYFEDLDKVNGKSPSGAFLRLGLGAASYALHALISVAVFTPVRIAFAIHPRRKTPKTVPSQTLG